MARSAFWYSFRVSSAERQLGVDLFNGTWRLIESREDDDLMLYMAHASAYHWAVAPECLPENRARGEWLVSRVSCCAVCRTLPAATPGAAFAGAENDLADWDLAYAYEALARASKLAGDDATAAAYLEQARAVPIADADDREHVDEDLGDDVGLEKLLERGCSRRTGR